MADVKCPHCSATFYAPGMRAIEGFKPEPIPEHKPVPGASKAARKALETARHTKDPA